MHASHVLPRLGHLLGRRRGGDLLRGALHEAHLAQLAVGSPLAAAAASTDIWRRGRRWRTIASDAVHHVFTVRRTMYKINPDCSSTVYAENAVRRLASGCRRAT